MLSHSLLPPACSCFFLCIVLTLSELLSELIQPTDTPFCYISDINQFKNGFNIVRNRTKWSESSVQEIQPTSSNCRLTTANPIWGNLSPYSCSILAKRSSKTLFLLFFRLFLFFKSPIKSLSNLQELIPYK